MPKLDRDRVVGKVAPGESTAIEQPAVDGLGVEHATGRSVRGRPQASKAEPKPEPERWPAESEQEQAQRLLEANGCSLSVSRRISLAGCRLAWLRRFAKSTES